jgi:nucleoside-diphosphate-sugar epimerase
MTGAGGLIGSAVSPVLAKLWDLYLTDRVPGAGGELDVTSGEACRSAFVGADAVIHLAAVAQPWASWEALHPANVVGAYEVARAAMDCGVRRLVLASSVHAVSGYPNGVQRRASDSPLPSTLYGATKAWAEALGGWVASSSATSVVALRLGFFAERPPSGAGDNARDLPVWLSPRDCAQLLRKAVEVDRGGFLIVNGVSANAHLGAELSSAAESIGYRPDDDAWAR